MKWFLFGFLTLGTWLFFLHKPLPQIDPSTKVQADLWAKQIEQASNKNAWDTTDVVVWTFVGRHHHIWDKKRKLHTLKKGDQTTIQSLHSRNAIYKEAKKDWRIASETEKNNAYNAWINDSFWLNPLSKLFDEGTQRHVVHIDGKDGLMISYMQGGLTPGDSYVWFVDQNNRPIHWKLWVSVIPIGGLGNSWEDWKQISTGAWISTNHKFGFVTMEISNLQGGSIQDIFETDPFENYCQYYEFDC